MSITYFTKEDIKKYNLEVPNDEIVENIIKDMIKNDTIKCGTDFNKYEVRGTYCYCTQYAASNNPNAGCPGPYCT